MKRKASSDLDPKGSSQAFTPKLKIKLPIGSTGAGVSGSGGGGASGGLNGGNSNKVPVPLGSGGSSSNSSTGSFGGGPVPTSAAGNGGGVARSQLPCGKRPDEDGYAFPFAGKPTYSPSRVEPSSITQGKGERIM